MPIAREDIAALLHLVKRAYVPLSGVTPAVTAVLDELQQLATLGGVLVVPMARTEDPPEPPAPDHAFANGLLEQLPISVPPLADDDDIPF